MGQVRDGFFPLQGSSATCKASSSCHSALISVTATTRVWHHSFGFPSSAIIQKVLSSNKVDVKGTNIVDFFYSDYAMAKNHKLPFGPTKFAFSKCLELLHFWCLGTLTCCFSEWLQVLFAYS